MCFFLSEPMIRGTRFTKPTTKYVNRVNLMWIQQFCISSLGFFFSLHVSFLQPFTTHTDRSYSRFCYCWLIMFDILLHTTISIWNGRRFSGQNTTLQTHHDSLLMNCHKWYLTPNEWTKCSSTKYIKLFIRLLLLATQEKVCFRLFRYVV